MNAVFDVIITTYNRPEFIKSLVQQISDCNLVPQNIIVVDSSDNENMEIQEYKSVKYIKSSHKNQPYQRFLGLNAAKSKIVTFFDDDVKILDKNLFKYAINSIHQKGIVGATLRFDDGGENAISIAMGTKKKKTNISVIQSILLAFTGVPIIKNNKIWLAALKSNFDYTLPNTEAIGGPGTLTVRTKHAYKLFNDNLFAMYETKLGKGEDKYMSVGLLKYGKIALISKECLYHPPHDSSYFKNAFTFSKRELFSRLWLSKRIASVKNINLFTVYTHYYWYALWRVIIAGIKVITTPSKINLERFNGKFMAVISTFTTSMRAKKLTPNINWKKDIQNDLKNN